MILASARPASPKSSLRSRAAKGLRWRWGWCWEGEGAPAFWPWIQVIRAHIAATSPEMLRAQMGSAAADIARIVPDLREKLPDLLHPPKLNPARARFRLFDGVTSFLKSTAVERPLVLIFEDLHRADQPSLRLLQFLAQEIADASLVVVGTYREVEIGRMHPLSQSLGELARLPNFLRLLLRGLSEEDVARLIALHVSSLPARSLAARVHRQTEGNPFFIGEMVRLLAAEPRLEWPRGDLVLGIPQSIRDAVGCRLNRLGDLLARGDRSAVHREIEAYGRLAQELRQPFYLWWYTTLRAMQAHVAGQLEEALQLAAEALRLGQRARDADAVQGFAGQQFHLFREQGRLGELEASIRDIVALFPFVPACRCALALLYAEGGRTAEAQVELEHVAAGGFANLPRDTNWLLSLAMLSETCAMIGDTSRAAALYELLHPYARHIVVSGPGTICLGAASRNLALLATTMRRWTDAEPHFEDALSANAAIASPSWTAHTAFGYAAMLVERDAPGDRTRAARLVRDAQQTADRLGMVRLQTRLRTLGDRLPETVPPADDAAGRALRSAGEDRTHTAKQCEIRPQMGVLRQEGEYWLVAYGGNAFRLKHSVGLHYLAALLRHPGREFFGADLLAMRWSEGEADGTDLRDRNLSVRAPAQSDAGVMIDAPACRAYRLRLQELREYLSEAQEHNDVERVRAIEAEMTFLTDQLAAAVGLRGRARLAGSLAERARWSVTRAIRKAVGKINTHDPSLGRYLVTTLKTGTFCSYTPDPRLPIAWHL